MKHQGSKTIRTERLVLRKVKKKDYRDMFEYLSKEEVAKYVSWTPHKNIKDTKRLVNAWWKRSFKKDHYRWCIVCENKVIGNVDVVFSSGNTAILGWQLDSAHWNKGFATEAVQAVRDFLLYEVGYNSIEACCVKENTASSRIMQKIGMEEIPYQEAVHYKINNQRELNGQEIIFFRLDK